MDYEKKYKDALEKLKPKMNDINDIIISREDFEEIFPELKESEDEKIRKEIINYFRCQSKDEPCRKTTHEKWINWLDETFGKKNPQGKTVLEAFNEKKVDNANNVESKFHEGDWVIQGCNILKIRYVGNEYYCFDVVGGFVDHMLISEIDSLYHLWTIQDAKDGDVLVDNYGNILIYEGPSTNTHYYSHCYGNKKLFIEQGASHEIECTYPANKEQRDILFAKMKEAGYKWDANKKELKKVNSYCQEHCKGYRDTGGRCFFDGGCEAKRKAEQNIANHQKTYKNGQKTLSEVKKDAESTWSGDDEIGLNNALWCCNEAARITKDENDNGSIRYVEQWLKSLKDRVKPQWKPSEEQLDTLHDAAMYVDNSMFPHQKGILMKLYKKLKKLNEE